MGRLLRFKEPIFKDSNMKLKFRKNSWIRKDGTIVRDDLDIALDKMRRSFGEGGSNAKYHHRRLRRLLEDMMANNKHIDSEELTSHMCAWVLSLYKRDANAKDIKFSFEPAKCEPTISEESKKLIEYFESLNWARFDQRIFGDIWMGLLSKKQRQEHGIEFT